jgi:hypothetical protein
MLVVKVELHSAITGVVSTLATLAIANDGRGTETKGDYDGWAFPKQPGSRPVDFTRPLPKPFKRGRVEGHPRLSQHVWHLVAKMLNNMGYGG